MKTLLTTHPTLRRALSRSAGITASIFGYPMIEMLRACRLQTRSRFGAADDERPGINCLSFTPLPQAGACSTNAHSNKVELDLSAWISMRDGIRRLDFSQGLPLSEEISMSLYDAYGERVAHFDRPAMPERGLLLAGPLTDGAACARPMPGYGLVRCSTELVWLKGAVTTDEKTRDSICGFAPEILLQDEFDQSRGARPAAVELWQGEPMDVFAAVARNRECAMILAPSFYANLCRALAQWPMRSEDKTVVARLRRFGIAPDASLDWRALDSQIRQGLILGLADAAQLVSAAALNGARRHPPRPAAPEANGPDYFFRAVGAYLRSCGTGLGAGAPIPGRRSIGRGRLHRIERSLGRDTVQRGTVHDEYRVVGKGYGADVL